MHMKERERERVRGEQRAVKYSMSLSIFGDVRVRILTVHTVRVLHGHIHSWKIRNNK